MSQLKPNRIVLHCGLHKTGSTYIQRNLQTNRELLLKQGVLYLGPNTFKKRCSELWRHLQWGRRDRRTPRRLISQTQATFIPEIWQGHKNNGEGAWLALERLEGCVESSPQEQAA